MESKDLGSKKMNNKQNMNEGFSGDNMSAMHNPSGPILKPDVEIDLNGNPIIVQRARDLDTTPVHIPEPTNHHYNENEDMNQDLSEGEVKRTVENKDRNSDITANRYPNSSPENRENRGNIKLDE